VLTTRLQVVKALGADATFSYKLPLDEQLSEIGRITGGKFSRVFDGSAFAAEAGMEALAKHGDSDAKVKYFATTNDWFVHPQPCLNFGI